MTATRRGPQAPHRVLAKLAELFGADLRSLAAFRVVLALLVLWDLLNRAGDLTAHYADLGVMPRSALLGEVLNPWVFSVNLMGGTAVFQGFLFGITALAALGLLVGYRTRLMTFVVWVLLLSIQHRNPLVLGSGEILLHLLIFWGMFLPLGAYWSLDRALRGTSPRPSIQFLSLGTVALFMQICFMYWFTAVLKSGAEWRESGTALYYALSLDQLSTPAGAFLLQFPEVLEKLTFSTLLLEAFGPFLLFCPFFTGPVRTATVAAFMSLHYGIWMTMDIGIFPWISAFCMVCFLPGWFWDRALPLLASPHPLGALGRLRETATRFVHDRWEPLRMRLSAAESGGPLMAGLPFARHGRWTVHALFATGTASREGTGSAGGTRGSDTTRVEATGTAPPLRSSRAANLAVAVLLVYVFCWNLSTVSSFALPERLVPPGFFLGLDQRWSMFAPRPSTEDGWYVMPGRLRGGQETDIAPIMREDYGLHPVSWEKPQSVADTYGNEHWRKYLENLRQPDYESQRLHFGRYLCREWNARHTGSEQLVSFEIVHMLEETKPDYQPVEPEKQILWEHSCF